MSMVLSRPFLGTCRSTPVVSDNALRLLIQLARHGTLTFEFGPYCSAVADPDGIVHKRQTVKGWGHRKLIHVEWKASTARVTITNDGIRWLCYLRDMINEVPL